MFRFPGATKAFFGASGGFGIGSRVVMFGEFDRVPMEKVDETIAGIRTTATMKLNNLGGGIRVILGDTEARVNPYIVAAVGAGQFNVSGKAEGRIGGRTISESVSESSWAVYQGVGGGVYFNLNRNLSIRPEFRYQRYQSTDLDAYANGVNAGFNSYVGGVSLTYRFGR